MVVYYNGRGVREKVFFKKSEAIEFLSKCGDRNATIWKELSLED